MVIPLPLTTKTIDFQRFLLLLGGKTVESCFNLHIAIILVKLLATYSCLSRILAISVHFKHFSMFSLTLNSNIFVKKKKKNCLQLIESCFNWHIAIILVKLLATYSCFGPKVDQIFTNLDNSGTFLDLISEHLGPVIESVK